MRLHRVSVALEHRVVAASAVPINKNKMVPPRDLVQHFKSIKPTKYLRGPRSTRTNESVPAVASTFVRAIPFVTAPAHSTVLSSDRQSRGAASSALGAFVGRCLPRPRPAPAPPPSPPRPTDYLHLASTFFHIREPFHANSLDRLMGGEGSLVNSVIVEADGVSFDLDRGTIECTKRCHDVESEFKEHNREWDLVLRIDSETKIKIENGTGVENEYGIEIRIKIMNGIGVEIETKNEIDITRV
ncbi:hypothetical protein EVAR_31780_1 [Eumeta japonica]|uniref:Uncharacterized protein n=1 Tax=Eumeta variegata TaxID=151549 RepID=A0A4C1W6T0_EUMVA|nr:hypothetical protein EVAR_31780_1 [Eumeta japonica]